MIGPYRVRARQTPSQSLSVAAMTPTTQFSDSSARAQAG